MAVESLHSSIVGRSPTNDSPGETKETEVVKPGLAVISGAEFSTEPSRPRNRERDLLAAGLFLMVLLPTLLGAVYFGAVASDRYVSSAKVMVKTDNDSSVTGEFAMMFGLGSTTSDESEMLVEYIQTTSMVLELEREISLRELWDDSGVDYFSRLSKNASNEDLFEYYDSMVGVLPSEGSSVIEIQVEAFTPQDATVILAAIIGQSELVLEQVFDSKRHDAIDFAGSELAKAEDRLLEVQDRITDFRRDHGELDPILGAVAVGEIAAGLEARLADERSALGAMLSYMREDNPVVIAQEARIESLEVQVQLERSRLVNADEADYADLVGAYQNLLVEMGFAEASYTAALTFLATTRQDLQRRHAYIVALAAPTVPDEAVLPERLWSILTIFVLSLLTFGILLLVVSSVREHAHN